MSLAKACAEPASSSSLEASAPPSLVMQPSTTPIAMSVSPTAVARAQRDQSTLQRAGSAHKLTAIFKKKLQPTGLFKAFTQALRSTFGGSMVR